MREATPSTLLLSSLLTLLVGASGCTLDLPEPQPPSPFTFCQDSAGCSNGRICEAGFCVVPTAIEETVAVQVSPLSTAQFPPEQFPAVVIEQDSPLPDLVLQEPSQITGLVQIEDDTLTTLRARIRLSRRQPTIAGRDLSLTTTATAAGGYFVRVPPGYWDVDVTAEDRDLPPLSFRGLPISNDTQLPIVFDEPEQYLDIQGQAVYLDTLTDQLVPVEGARVRAINEDLDTVSTVASTDADGNFSIFVRSDVNRYDLVIAPPSNPAVLPRAVFRDLEVVGENVNIGVQSIGHALAKGRRVEGQLRTPISGPIDPEAGRVDDAEVIFQADLGDPETPNISTQFTTSVLARADGSYTVSLQPGLYTALVTPPVDSPYAITELTNIEVKPPGSIINPVDFRLRLNEKVRIEGQIRMPGGDALEALTLVSFELLDVSGIQSISRDLIQRSQRNVTVVTDSQGRFSISVDPGQYRVQAIPPDDTGLARSVPRRIRVSADQADLDLCATEPNVAYGVVRAESGLPLAEAKVEIFRLNSERGQWLLGSGRTDANGFYRVLVPQLCDGDPACEVECQ